MARNKLPLALSAALLLGGLCACSGPEAGPTPTPEANHTTEQTAVRWLSDENHKAFQVGDFWVTMEDEETGAEEPGFTMARLTVWDPTDLSAPLQTMEQPTDACLFGRVQVVDANFDGCPDFGSMYAMGNQPVYYDFWLWDGEQGRFVEEPALSEISDPQFDAVNGIVSGYARAGWAGAAGEHTFYQWMDGRLTLIRRVWTDVEPAEAGGVDTLVLAVEDRRDGVLTEVFRQTYPLEGGDWLDVRAQWCDLDYQGA